MEMDEVKSRLIEGIKLAQSAIKLDTADGNMQKSSHLYISAIQCFQDVLPNLTEENQVLLQNKIALYEKRVFSLAEYFRNMKELYSKRGISIGEKGRKSLQAKKVSLVPQIIFKEDHSLLTKFMALPPPPPEQSELRAFWLIDIISRSITSGSFITANIWIPKEIWLQTNIQLNSQIEKIACLRVTEELFSKIDANKIKDMRNLPSELDSLYEDLTTIQNHLSFMVDSINEIKINLTNSRDKKIYIQRKNIILERIQDNKESIIDVQCVDTTEYISTISSVLKKAVIFEKIFKQIGDTKEPIFARIFELNKKITAFLNSTIIWILYDLGILLKEYLKKSKENFLHVPSLLDDSDDGSDEFYASISNVPQKVNIDNL